MIILLIKVWVCKSKVHFQNIYYKYISNYLAGSLEVLKYWCSSFHNLTPSSNGPGKTSEYFTLVKNDYIWTLRLVGMGVAWGARVGCG